MADDEKTEATDDKADRDFGDPAEQDDQTADDTGSNEPEEAEEQEAESESSFSDDLLTRAVSAGMTIAEAKSLKTPEALEAVLAAVKKQGESASQKTADETKEEVDQDLTIDLDDALVDPEVLKGMQTLAGAINTLRAQIAGLTEHISEQRKTTAQTEFDGLIEEQGEAWHDLLGKGPTADLPPNGKHRQARDAIQGEMEVLRAGFKNTGRNLPSEGEIFTRALRGLYADQLESITTKKVAGKVKKRRGQALARTTQRRGSQQKGEAAALAAVKARMADEGTLEDQIEFASDEIPDDAFL
jgi:hypothetical protein